MKPAHIRLIHALSVYSAVTAILLVAFHVRFVAKTILPRLGDLSAGTPPPIMTRVLVTAGPRAPLIAVFTIPLLLSVAYFLMRTAPTPDRASTRLLLFVVMAFIGCLVVIASSSLSLMLPFVRSIAIPVHP